MFDRSNLKNGGTILRHSNRFSKRGSFWSGATGFLLKAVAVSYKFVSSFRVFQTVCTMHRLYGLCQVYSADGGPYPFFRAVVSTIILQMILVGYMMASSMFAMAYLINNRIFLGALTYISGRSNLS